MPCLLRGPGGNIREVFLQASSLGFITIIPFYTSSISTYEVAPKVLFAVLYHTYLWQN